MCLFRDIRIETIVHRLDGASIPPLPPLRKKTSMQNHKQVILFAEMCLKTRVEFPSSLPDPRERLAF